MHPLCSCRPCDAGCAGDSTPLILSGVNKRRRGAALTNKVTRGACLQAYAASPESAIQLAPDLDSKRRYKAPATGRSGGRNLEGERVPIPVAGVESPPSSSQHTSVPARVVPSSRPFFRHTARSGRAFRRQHPHSPAGVHAGSCGGPEAPSVGGEPNCCRSRGCPQFSVAERQAVGAPEQSGADGSCSRAGRQAGSGRAGRWSHTSVHKPTRGSRSG